MKDRLVLRSALLASVALTALACSLGTSGLGAGGSGGRDDGTPATIPTGPHVNADAAPTDAAPPSSSAVDAGALPGATDAAPAPVNCDVDGDGHLATGPACGGDDCCDEDALTAPGQTAYFETPNGCGGFDYDCSGVPEPELGVAMCKLNFLSCDGDGFSAPTPCGAQADFVSCAFAGVVCNETRKPRTQACR
jgi:hypothetical protein